MKSPEIIFFMGKGGTGKSTVSALAGVTFAQEGKRVMVVSLDSAHNLSDIFKIKLSDKPVKMDSNLFAREVDQEKIIQRYLKNTRDSLKRTYSYLTAFNLDGYFDILKYSPGLEEYALILAFQLSLEKYSDFDYLIFDMPPTALTLKFFNLPFLSKKWIEHLKTLRQEINKKKEIVSKVKFAGKEFTKDKILSRINDMRDQYERLETIFQDQKKTKIFVVLNDNSLAVVETKRILKELEKNSVFIQKIIWNRGKKDGSKVDSSFLPDSIVNLYLPDSKIELTGFKALKNYIKINYLQSKAFSSKVTRK
ncbi:MAG: ArsA family ATPase [Thermodesulfobacteriota bacterium]|nr:ArsA family ATPase [Thermodesulfobacteriota bacterium]